MKKIITPLKKTLFIIPFLILLSNNSYAKCNDCYNIKGEFQIKEVGVVVNDYDFIVTTIGNKVQIPSIVVPMMRIALLMGSTVYMDTSIGSYALYAD